MPIVVPSLLSAPFDRLGEAVASLEDAGVRLLHYDVMDGHFVPNLTMGPLIINNLQDKVQSQFDVHLMVTNPEEQIDWFDLPSVRSITIHVEASKDMARDLNEIRRRGKKAGASINPNTSPTELEPYLNLFDQVLVMTVFPGKGGQAFIPETVESIRYMARRKQEEGLSYIIQVDGGIKPETIAIAAQAGAEELVAGSAVFKHSNYAKAIQTMMDLITSP